jgi:membrane protein DedA with SNARE-associated domain
MESFAEWLVEFVDGFGYFGIFIMTFAESTFVPIPAEVTMIPVGYLAQRGDMNFVLAFLISIAGTMSGSLFNYWIAMHYGRRFLKAYGRYMLFPTEKMEKMERYFKSHGEISIFTGRLIPGLRHFISFPAGLAHMQLKKFCFYTTLGGGIWMFTLMMVGYLIGGNKKMVKHSMPYITGIAILLVVTSVVLYIRQHRKNLKKEQSNGLAG